ncbi:RING-H2 finger protein ATL56-like [Hordeum vulgare subsp. vulgare]|uniref:RING-type domain-containing protein n=1 Tax=Hordeum vulgare subsp. vulgare TaxID=112509 RepID=A0A8I6YFC7_HORVV|nr:RING-H2 finger protein ATL56-like [Hordeum vulgare subsp. vulgare]
MDSDDMIDWIIWVVLLTFIVAAALIAVVVLSLVIAEVVRHVRQRCKSLSIERLLESIPDVAYKQKPDRDGGSLSEEEEGKELPRSQSSCVICMAQYEGGERCSVLPGCGHVFHTGCVATWLHTTHNTCPLCRATIGADAVAGKVNAAEDMV